MKKILYILLSIGCFTMTALADSSSAPDLSVRLKISNYNAYKSDYILVIKDVKTIHIMNSDKLFDSDVLYVHP